MGSSHVSIERSTTSACWRVITRQRPSRSLKKSASNSFAIDHRGHKRCGELSKEITIDARDEGTMMKPRANPVPQVMMISVVVHAVAEPVAAIIETAAMKAIEEAAPAPTEAGGVTTGHQGARLRGITAIFAAIGLPAPALTALTAQPVIVGARTH